MICRVNVEICENGYVVTLYSTQDGKNRTYVAKDEKDLIEIFREVKANKRKEKK